MGVIAILLSAALLVLAIAFGLHCLVSHCDRATALHVRSESDRAR